MEDPKQPSVELLKRQGLKRRDETAGRSPAMRVSIRKSEEELLKTCVRD